MSAFPAILIFGLISAIPYLLLKLSSQSPPLMPHAGPAISKVIHEIRASGPRLWLFRTRVVHAFTRSLELRLHPNGLIITQWFGPTVALKKYDIRSIEPVDAPFSGPLTAIVHSSPLVINPLLLRKKFSSVAIQNLVRWVAWEFQLSSESQTQ